MSINSALLSGVSGLLANAAKLGTISDNIANVNTVGYKRNQTDFQTIVTAASGSKGGYSAGGVLAQSMQRVTQQGQLQRTGNATDLGINGQGFFITTERPENIVPADARMFTRAGAFTVDEFGYLRNSAGLYLQGWPVDPETGIDFDPSDLTRLSSINVAQVGGAAEQTTRSTIKGNLDNSQPISAVAAAYDLTAPATTMSGTDGTDGVRADFEISIPVIDSKGERRNFTLSLLKAADANGVAIPNTWRAELRAEPATDIERDGAVQNGLIRAGDIVFTPSGALDIANSTLFAAGTGNVLSLGESAAPVPAGGVKWATALGVAGQDVRIDLEAMSQYAATTELKEVTSNGTGLGSLANIEIDPEGFVNAIFDNGVTRRVAQIALATFPNPDGLKGLSGNSYLASNESGTFNLKVPGSGGAGLLSAATLEASTVDLSTEFTGLITTQRAYSASSKIITTADEMLEELIRIKR